MHMQSNGQPTDARAHPRERRTVSPGGEADRARALLAVASRLTTLTDPGAIPDAIADAIHDSTAGRAAIVGRRLRNSAGFAVVAASGPSADARAAVAGLELPATTGSAAAELLAGAATSRLAGDEALARLAGLVGASVAAAAPIVITGTVWGFVAIGEPD